jgi:hypothetical protein
MMTARNEFDTSPAGVDAILPPVPKFRSVWALFAGAGPLGIARWVWGAREAPSHFRGPVRWLLSRQLLSKLGKLVSELLYSKELDHRDWMKVAVHDLQGTQCGSDEPFWFDYVADIGDGQLANYNLACLMLGRLALMPENETTVVDGTPRRRLVALDDPVASRAGGASRLVSGPDVAILPRGTFLLVGADTAYHVADFETLTQRTQAPFHWAHQRIHGKGLPTAEDPRHAPWIFAIPGNHDLYDSLIGFNKFFARPHDEAADERTRIADFNRLQTGSYFGLDLPHGFRLVAMHSQGGHVDHRQATLLARWVREDEEPRPIRRKLIVATSQPSTVFRATNKDSRRPFEAAKLPRPFAKSPDAWPDNAIHLDLSGDVHHYERYVARAPENYQSVVAGGGAFSHPTYTVRARDRNLAWPPDPVTLYPRADVSLATTLMRLLQPNRLFAGGLVWLVGGLIAGSGCYGLAWAPWLRGGGQRAEGIHRWWPRAVPWTEVTFDACLIVAGLVWWWAHRRAGVLKFEQRGRATTWRDHFPVSFATGLGILIVLSAIAGAPPEHTIGRIGFAVVALIATLGLALGAGVGGALGQSVARRAVLSTIAVSLGVSVLVLPTLLIRYATWQRLVLAIACTWLVALLASALFATVRFSHRALLVVLTGALYATLLLVPCWVVAANLGFWSHPSETLGDLPGHWAVFAFGVGALLTCVWFPGYLALAFSLNCHNNEAGITVRVDRFCHFIRFKLEPERITGYVIGVAKLADASSELRPVVVETFTLTSASTPEGRQ